LVIAKRSDKIRVDWLFGGRRLRSHFGLAFGKMRWIQTNSLVITPSKYGTGNFWRPGRRDIMDFHENGKYGKGIVLPQNRRNFLKREKSAGGLSTNGAGFLTLDWPENNI